MFKKASMTIFGEIKANVDMLIEHLKEVPIFYLISDKFDEVRSCL